MKIDILKIGLDPLLQFESIARSKSLKQAALELRLSQPAITQSLKRLEGSLGVQLCVRSRSGFALTESGKKLFQLSQQIKSQLKDYERFLSEEKEFDGLLGIGVIDNFQNSMFEKAINKTIQTYPKMKLSIQVHAAQEIQSLLIAGEIELGLGIFNKKHEELTYRTIGTETIGHFISDRHPLWSKQAPNMKDIRDLTKTWVDIINRDRSTLEKEFFSDKKVQVAKVRSYTNNLNVAAMILRSGTSIVPMPVEYLESRKLDFKYRALDSAFKPYSLKQEVAILKDFLNASPAAKFFLDQLPKF